MAGFKGGMGGMGNMQNLMREAQKMQEQMQEADKELVVYMNAKKIINGIEFGSKLSQIVDITDEDDVEMLEDLIMAAINDGYKKADALYDEKMGPFAKAGKGFI